MDFIFQLRLRFSRVNPQSLKIILYMILLVISPSLLWVL